MSKNSNRIQSSRALAKVDYNSGLRPQPRWWMNKQQKQAYILEWNYAWSDGLRYPGIVLSRVKKMARKLNNLLD